MMHGFYRASLTHQSIPFSWQRLIHQSPPLAVALVACFKVINGKNGAMMKNHTIKRPRGKREALAHSWSFLMSSHLCLFTGVMKPDLLTQFQKLWVIVIVRWEPESVTTTSCLRAEGRREMKINVESIGCHPDTLTDEGRRSVIGAQRRGGRGFLLLRFCFHLF